MKPICIDLFCGLGGWTDGFLAEGYDCIGFDIERHDYGSGGYPGSLVLQDILTLHGSQFKDATVIVASPPCQEYSFRAQPWKVAKAQKPDVLPDWWKLAEPPKKGFDPSKHMNPSQFAEWQAWKRNHPLPPCDNSLFDACFRIQREACEAAGRHIPMVVENVRGAQKWAGRSVYNYGSFHLWGDVPALMVKTENLAQMREGHSYTRHLTNQAEHDGVKHGGDCFSDPSWPGRQGGSKQPGISGPRENGKGDAWFQDGAARHGSKSNARKAASAQIAMIPFALSRHIARCFK